MIRTAAPTTLAALAAAMAFNLPSAAVAEMHESHSDHAAHGDKMMMNSEAKASIQKLMDGNERFVSGELEHPNLSKQYREELAGGQSPYAVIVGCSDSRVPPELVFDAGPGDLFVIRDAGNVVGDNEMASVEYAVAKLGTPVVVVLSHENCGAVGAAVATATEGAEFDGKIDELVEVIMPAVKSAQKRADGPELTEAAIEDNAQRVAKQLRESDPYLAKAVAEGKVMIVAARYDLDTGKVTAYPDMSMSHDHAHGDATHGNQAMTEQQKKEKQMKDEAAAGSTTTVQPDQELVKNPEQHRDHGHDAGTNDAPNANPPQGDAADRNDEIVDIPSQKRNN